MQIHEEYEKLENVDLDKGDILSMLKDLPDACCIFKILTNPFGTIKDMLFLFANEKYGQLVGRRTAELIGNTYYTIIDNRDEDWLKFSYQAAMLRQSTISRTYNSKYDKWFEFWAVPVYQKGYCAFIIHDVTSIAKNEENITISSNTDQLIIKCASAISQNEFGNGIVDALQILGQNIKADRVHIISSVKTIDKFIWENKACGIVFPTHIMYNEFNLLDFWEKQLGERDFFVCNDTNLYREEYETIYNEIFAGKIARYIVIKLKNNKETIGYLIADNYESGLPLNIVNAMKSVALFLTAEFKNKILTDEMFYLENVDTLTKLNNRKMFKQNVEVFSNLSINFGVFYFKLNDLNKINEEKGYSEGDKFILRNCDLMTNIFDTKNCYRIGDNEFMAIVPEISRNDFVQMSEKLQNKFKNKNITTNFEWNESTKDIKKIVKRVAKKNK